MTQAEINNALKYTLLALAAFTIGCATALVPQLMDPTLPVLNWRIVLGTGITAVITAYGGAMLPRAGSTAIAAQVDNLKAAGTDKRDMVVIKEDEAVPILAGALSPSQVAQVADEIEARLRQTPADTANVPDHIIGLIDRAERDAGERG